MNYFLVFHSFIERDIDLKGQRIKSDSFSVNYKSTNYDNIFKETKSRHKNRTFFYKSGKYGVIIFLMTIIGKKYKYQ